jgi:hypothetical protein
MFIFIRIVLCANRIVRLLHWVDEGPLKTVQRVMHLMYPDTIDWRIYPEDVRNDPDPDLLRLYTWSSPCPPDCDCGETPTAVVVAVQPSWILSDKDFDDFVNCDTVRPVAFIRFRPPNVRVQFPQYEVNKSRLHSRHRIWAKVRIQLRAFTVFLNLPVALGPLLRKALSLLRAINLRLVGFRQLQ